MNKKKWLTLSAISIGLLLIPRRSSRKATLSSNPLSKKEQPSEKANIEKAGTESQNYKKQDTEQ